VFNSLTKQDVSKIAELQVKLLAEKLSKMGIKISVTKSAIAYIVDKGYNPEYGARPLRRVLQSEIEDKVAEQMLADSPKNRVSVDAEDGKLSFKFA